MGSHCHSKAKVCEICGGNHPRDEVLLATCSECNIACEHVYCMREVEEEVPEDWVCESCLTGSDLILKESGKKDAHVTSSFQEDEAVTRAIGYEQFSVSQLHSKKQKPVETGKVKFIPHEEVMRLSSGTTETKFYFSHTRRSTFQRTTRKSRTMNPKAFSDRVKSYPCKPYGLARPFRDATPKSSMVNQQMSRTFKEPKASEIPSVASGKLHANQKQSMDVISVPKNHCDFFENKMENSTKKSSLCSTPVDPGGKTKDVAQHDHSNVQGDLPNFQPSFALYLDYFPAPDATWKGDFSILNWNPSEIFSGFQARLPCKIHPKVYEISRKMPPVLQVKMLPQSNFLVDLFQDECPDLLDVAMYFFPDDNIERSRQNYVKLVEHMEIHEFFLRSHINDVELLIFTSTQLNVDSQNVLSSESKHFFWGIFRSTNDKPLPSNAQEELPSSQADEDMEIDMVGGISVGRVDVIVPRESSTRRSTIQDGDTTCPTISVDVDSSIQGRRHVEVKKEELSKYYNQEHILSPPPGFEKMFKSQTAM
ncbi:protein PARALOG OF AIPP2-like isoform X2 [Humulus lupulus]|uniref:protein PARALOG OF AIPP2-like isoform X2 n=1 Tax=Humulus lupulus TaxID=3486 RepID=UPI002B41147B|nr:protein PARALOG OF AIPP2-like isoform X2 [Humulus lupulus]